MTSPTKELILFNNKLYHLLDWDAHPDWYEEWFRRNKIPKEEWTIHTYIEVGKTHNWKQLPLFTCKPDRQVYLPKNSDMVYAPISKITAVTPKIWRITF